MRSLAVIPFEERFDGITIEFANIDKLSFKRSISNTY